MPKTESKLQRQFDDPGVRQRGHRYFCEGRVRLKGFDDDSLNAEVRGTRTYRTRLTQGRRGLRLQCDCPHAAGGAACKHLWATLLEVHSDPSATAWLEGIVSVPDQRLLDRATGWDEVADDVDDSYEDERGSGFGSGSGSGSGFGSGSGSGSGSNSAGSLFGSGSSTSGVAPWSPRTPRAHTPDWEIWLRSLDGQLPPTSTHGTHPSTSSPRPKSAPQPIELGFFVSEFYGDSLVGLEVRSRQQRKDGTWGVFREGNLKREDMARIEPPDNAAVLDRLLGAQDWRLPQTRTLSSRFGLEPELFAQLGPELAARGSLFDPEGEPLQWDDGGTWVVTAVVRPGNAPGKDPGSEPRKGSGSRPGNGAGSAPSVYETRILVRRGEESDDVEMFTPLTHPFSIRDGKVVRVEGPLFWSPLGSRVLRVPAEDVDTFLESLVSKVGGPRLDAPAELEWTSISPEFQPRLVLMGQDEVPPPFRNSQSDTDDSWVDYAKPQMSDDELAARVEFDYSGVAVDWRSRTSRLVDSNRRTVIDRSLEDEASRLAELRGHGAKAKRWAHGPFFTVKTSRLPDLVQMLTPLGWDIRAKDQPMRSPGSIKTSLRSEIDWFELDVRVEYAQGVFADVSDLLRAAKRGERTVQLGDGSIGLLPEEWMERNGFLLESGQKKEESLRFEPSQAALLAVLLEQQTNVDVDATFDRIRSEIESFHRVEPEEARASFKGKLRSYQREALGWFGFLRRFDFGGCLADDMGLGKTVMVLALLDSRRGVRAQGGKEKRPSLVVVPRSLVFNWMLEATKFAPKLQVFDFSGPSRGTLASAMSADVIITTYGVLRRDVLDFKEAEFDYAILDESQAIKNSNTATARAARLLQARHRLAMSGTPIENHLGELWSLFAFLNPGLLGGAGVFKRFSSRTSFADTEQQDGTVDMVARAVRPFLLRRTKEQVATELPPKEEQTVYCDLSRAQRRFYDGLRDHYRRSLLENRKKTKESTRQNQIEVLEALLRLRQAACHPGLVDSDKAPQESAKLDLLMDRLLELHSEGHKALVFSQFTSLLALAKDRLNAHNIPFEYLDGQTRNRAEKVKSFQESDDIRVFLISLKAGGTGLNLTTASYVFLLDPWWNPAAEAQAIDRAHRIGQQRPVLACRLVARDTVEERILELQERKRDLADSIVRAETSLLRGLNGEDLELLLS